MPEQLRAATNYAAEIQAVADRLRDLIMKDELLPDDIGIIVSVRDRLDEMQMELYNLAGSQELFQLWSK